MYKIFGQSLKITLLISILGPLSGILMARILTVEQRGLYLQIQLVASIIGGISSTGFPSALIYYAHKNNSKSIFERIISLELTLSPILIFIGFLIISTLFPNNNEYSLIYLLVIPLMLLSSTSLAFYQATNNFFYWNTSRLLIYGFWTCLLAIIYFLELKVTAELLTITYLSYLGSVVLFQLISIKPKLPKLNHNYGTTKKLLKFSIANTVSNSLQVSTLKIDQVLITIFFSLETAGLYAIALTWSNALGPLFSTINNILFPALVSSNSENKKNRTILSNSLGFFLNTLSSIILLLITPFAIKLIFGTKYSQSTSMAMILICAIFFQNQKNIILEYFRSEKNHSFLIRQEILTVILLTVFALVGIKFIFQTNLNIPIAYMLAQLLSFVYCLRSITEELNVKTPQLILSDWKTILNSIKRMI